MSRAIAFLFATVLTLLSGCSSTTMPVPQGVSLSDKPLFGKFVWHDLVTTNLEADKRFYGGLFGWEFEQRTGPRGAQYTLARSGGVYVAGMVDAGAEGKNANVSRWVGYLSVPDVDAAVKRNGEAGGETAVAPLDISGIGRVAGIVDPQGAVLGLARSSVGDPDDSGSGIPGSVAWNELLATDAAGAAQYYSELAGYEVEELQRRGGLYRMMKSGSARRAGVLASPLGLPESNWLVYFQVSDINSAVGRVEQLGGKVMIAPSPDVREGNMALIVDPSGALLALQQQPR